MQKIAKIAKNCKNCKKLQKIAKIAKKKLQNGENEKWASRGLSPKIIPDYLIPVFTKLRSIFSKNWILGQIAKKNCKKCKKMQKNVQKKMKKNFFWRKWGFQKMALFSNFTFGHLLCIFFIRN